MRQKVIQYYTASNGKTPVLEWLDRIKDIATQSRIEHRLERISLGHYGDYKTIGAGLAELRLDFGPGYRMYFSEQADDIVMFFSAGNKSTQARDIAAARAYLKELKGRVYDA